MLGLKIHRAEVPQCRMEPFFIVDLIEESGYVIHDILVGLVFVEINLFVLHRFDEALRLGVDSWAAAFDQEYFTGVSTVVGSLSYLGFNCRLTRMTIQRFK